MAVQTGNDLTITQIEAEFDQGAKPWKLSALGLAISKASGSTVKMSDFRGLSSFDLLTLAHGKRFDKSKVTWAWSSTTYLNGDFTTTAYNGLHSSNLLRIGSLQYYDYEPPTEPKLHFSMLSEAYFQHLTGRTTLFNVAYGYHVTGSPFGIFLSHVHEGMGRIGKKKTGHLWPIRAGSAQYGDDDNDNYVSSYENEKIWHAPGKKTGSGTSGVQSLVGLYTRPNDVDKWTNPQDRNRGFDLYSNNVENPYEQGFTTSLVIAGDQRNKDTDWNALIIWDGTTSPIILKRINATQIYHPDREYNLVGGTVQIENQKATEYAWDISKSELRDGLSGDDNSLYYGLFTHNSRLGRIDLSGSFNSFTGPTLRLEETLGYEYAGGERDTPTWNVWVI